MNLYLLKRDDSKVGWDEFEGFVVRAINYEQAREIIGYEYDDDYTITLLASGVTGEPTIILGAFKNG